MSINISVTPLNSGTLTVGSTTQPSVTLSVAGGIGPPGLGNLMIVEGDGINIATVGNVATISTNLTIPANLADLADVAAAAPSTGQVLTYNGSAWTAAADSTNLTGYATKAFVTSAVANLVDSSPAALDTLNELAAALGDDANFAANVTASLAGKANLSHTHTAADVTDFAAAAAANAPVQSVNNATGSITIANGTGLTLTESGSTLTLTAALPPSNLADLADVSGSPSANQALIYNGTEWQPDNIPAVSTLNGFSGAIELQAGEGLTLTTVQPLGGEPTTYLAFSADVQDGDVDGGTFGAAGNVLTEGGDNLAAESGDTLTVESASEVAGDSIQLLRSNVAGATPSSLLAGELAINTQDELLFYANASGTISSLSLSQPSGGGGSSYGTLLLFG